MLNLVPHAGAGRKVADLDDEARVVSKLLQLSLPHPRDRTVAAARVRSDEDSLRVRVALAADAAPPFRDGGDGEPGRVVVDTDVDEAAVVGDVVNLSARLMAAAKQVQLSKNFFSKESKVNEFVCLGHFVR